jgi:hypothetical protein
MEKGDNLQMLGWVCFSAIPVMLGNFEIAAK